MLINKNYGESYWRQPAGKNETRALGHDERKRYVPISEPTAVVYEVFVVHENEFPAKYTDHCRGSVVLVYVENYIQKGVHERRRVHQV